jgi:hypothetical protein
MGLKNGGELLKEYLLQKSFLRVQGLVFKDVWHVNKSKSKSFTW